MTDLQVSKRLNAIVIQLNCVASDIRELDGEFPKLRDLVDDAITEAVYQDIAMDDIVNSKM